MKRKKSIYGFNLIELMVVVAIIAFLSMLVIPHLTQFLARSKRSEAYITLRSLYLAEKAFWLEHGVYTTLLQGAQSLGWKPEGALHYTYGFTGAEGRNNVTGSLKTPASALQGSRAAADGFTICAAGDIDGDGMPDVLSIDHNGVIKIEKDDLQ